MPADPAIILRARSEDGEPAAGFWNAGLFRTALRAGALEKLEGLSLLAHVWRPEFEARPDWDPGADLERVILASHQLTSRDKRQVEKQLKLAARMSAEKLSATVRPVIERMEPQDEGERAWLALLLAVAKDVRRILVKRLAIITDPESQRFVPRVLEAIVAYFRVMLALDRVREERLEFMVERYRQLQSISGLIEGPTEFADRHTDYSAPRSR